MNICKLNNAVQFTCSKENKSTIVLMLPIDMKTFEKNKEKTITDCWLRFCTCKETQVFLNKGAA